MTSWTFCYGLVIRVMITATRQCRMGSRKSEFLLTMIFEIINESLHKVTTKFRLDPTRIKKGIKLF